MGFRVPHPDRFGDGAEATMYAALVLFGLVGGVLCFARGGLL